MARYEDGEMEFADARDAIVAVLRAAPCYSEDEAMEDAWSFSGIVGDDLAYADNVHEFDSALEALYDRCDDDRIWIDPIR